MIEYCPTPKQEAEKYGGQEKDWSEYTKRDTVPSCDKGGHRERSVYNQPNHQKHWSNDGKTKVR